jgi:hypothetical protein
VKDIDQAIRRAEMVYLSCAAIVLALILFMFCSS